MRVLAPGIAAVVLGLAGTAGATTQFDLVWTSTTGTGSIGGTAIDAAAGDILTADLLMTAGTEGVSAYGVSLRFDADLANELDLEAWTEPAMVGGGVFPCSPFPTCFTMAPPSLTALTIDVGGTQESTPTMPGFVFTYEATTIALGPVASDGALVIGTVTFSVNATVATDGADVETGAFNVGTDGVIDNVGTDQLLAGNVIFGGAAVNGAPEPGVTALLGLGLIGLLLAGRRARR